jgi:xanthine dehydrogenase accessory factor
MALAFFSRALVVVRGGGDLGSGVIYRLHRAGFPVIVTERATPLLVRRTVCYGEAVYSDSITIGSVMAQRVDTPADALELVESGIIPVLVDEDDSALVALKPVVAVDARMQKVNLGTTIADAPLVVALGPGFNAGVDCHAVIETNRGHDLGRVIEDGPAEPDTGEPGAVGGQTHSRVLRAPAAGHIVALAEIGDTVEAGQTIAQVDGAPVVAAFRGVLRGLIHERVYVTSGMKIGDLDPRARREHCVTISDKSLAIGGGVLEAVFSSGQVRPFLAVAP